MMELPFFSRYPTWTIPFQLVRIPFGMALRTYHFVCKGVVGRFSGLDVTFLGRLKKPESRWVLLLREK